MRAVLPKGVEVEVWYPGPTEAKLIQGIGIMILNVMIGDEWQHAETEAERAALISEAMEALHGEGTVLIGGREWPTPGNTVLFSISDRRHDSSLDGLPDNYLAAAADKTSGYGVLLWHVMASFPPREGITDSVWVSDNPEPPATDPRIVADTGTPTFHDPRSALPLPRIRAAVEEFCSTGTGDRPESIDWARCGLNGHRPGDRS